MIDQKNISREMHYQTFLVSCWQEHNEVTEKTSLRFRVEIPKSGEYHLCMSIKDVIAIIEVEIHKNFERDRTS
jgi:uncharacterized membrane protein